MPLERFKSLVYDEVHKLLTDEGSQVEIDRLTNLIGDNIYTFKDKVLVCGGGHLDSFFWTQVEDLLKPVFYYELLQLVKKFGYKYNHQFYVRWSDIIQQYQDITKSDWFTKSNFSISSFTKSARKNI